MDPPPKTFGKKRDCNSLRSLERSEYNNINPGTARTKRRKAPDNYSRSTGDTKTGTSDGCLCQ